MASIEVKSSVVSDDGFDEWFNDLYSPEKYSEEEIKQWQEAYQYQGYERNDVLKQLRKLVPDVKELTQIIIICALRGPKRAAQSKLQSGRTVESYKIPASGMKGTKGVSCQRITAATADLAAFYLKKMNTPKRLMVDCPGWLQFPSAGSIILPDGIRQRHIEFSKQFSSVIGGVFNGQIYQQMINNAYLSSKLKQFLFGDSMNELFPPLPSSGLTSSQSSSSSSSSSSVPNQSTIAASASIKTKQKGDGKG